MVWLKNHGALQFSHWEIYFKARLVGELMTKQLSIDKTNTKRNIKKLGKTPQIYNIRTKFQVLPLCIKT